MDSDILQEVTSDEIPKILKLWKKSLPDSFIQCQTLENMEKLKTENVKNPKQILYRCGDIESGVYVHLLITDLGELKDNWISVFTTDLSELSRVLNESNVIPWQESVLVFCCTTIELRPIIYKAGVAKGLKLQTEECNLLWLPPEASFEIGDIPNDVTLEYLDFSHGAVVNSTWPYREPGTDVLLGLLIQNNFGLGIFRKSDKKLVCSTLSRHFGGIFVLHTDPEFRNKGYAQLIVGHMVKNIRKLGQIPFCTVDPKNTPSLNLFKKMGIFRKSDRKLVCSALSRHFGGIFVLHTDPEFRNKGFAQLMVGHMVKNIRKLGQIPFCVVNINNTPSFNLFEKMGFKVLNPVDFIWK